MLACRARGVALVLGACAAGGGACSGDATRVTLAPIHAAPGDCGAPAAATELRVTAYTGGGDVVRAVPVATAFDITDFPADTEGLGIEVLVGGGVVEAAGKTAPFELAALADGSTLPVFMAPPGGACATGSLAVARAAPLLARAGDGVLVVGGLDAAGGALGSIERYDSATGTFIAVDVPDVLAESGFVGAALVELSGGRVAITGGPRAAITIYDPVTHALGVPVLVESRAFHAGIVIDLDHLLLAGGCSDVAAGACGGVVRRSSRIYALDRLGSADAGPTLVAGRLNARGFDAGLQRSGAHAYVVAGGTPAPDASDPEAADTFAWTPSTPAPVDATPLAPTYLAVTQLDGGGVLTASATAASIVVAGAVPGAAVPVAAPSARAGAQLATQLATQEDGRVVAIEGAVDGPGTVALYDPARDRWTRRPLASGAEALVLGVDPRTIRLADGSVLVVGGAPASTVAAIYRPSLIGPGTGSVTIIPGDSGDSGDTGGAGVDATPTATPVDPRTVSRGPEFVLAASDRADDLAPVLAGGPRLATGTVRATVRVQSGGVVLVARYRAAGDLLAAQIAPGVPTQLVRIDGGTTRTLCTGSAVPAFDPGTATTLALAIAGTTATVTRDGSTLLRCTVPAGERGAWGIAAAGPGGAFALATLTVSR